MLKREKNESLKKKPPLFFFKEERVAFAFFIFIFPALALLTLRILGIQTNFFGLLFFMGGSFLEFLLLLFLYSAYKQAKLNRAQWKRYIYLVYTALGLPFTVYLAQSPNYNTLALLRFLAVIAFLFPIAERKALQWHVSFFFCGVLFYQFLQTDRSFFYREQGVILVFYILGLCLICYREAAMAFLRKRNFYNQLHRRRWEGKYKKQSSFLSASLQALGYSHKDSQQIDKYGKDKYQNSGNYLICAFFFSAIHEALWDFQKNSEHSYRRGLDEFQREWEIFSNHIRQKLSLLEVELAIASDHLIAGALLSSYQREERKQTRLNLLQKKRIFQIFFALHELLEFNRRTRCSLEQRGHNGWYLNLLMTLGPAVCMQNSSSNPALVFRGPVIKKLNRDIGLIESQNSNTNAGPLSDRIWVETRLQKLYENRFEMNTALVCGDWKSPEFLLSEYTKERSRLSPNQNFWASLEQTDGIG